MSESTAVDFRTKARSLDLVVIAFADLSKPFKLLLQISMYANNVRAPLPYVSILAQPGIVRDGSIIMFGHSVESKTI